MQRNNFKTQTENQIEILFIAKLNDENKTGIAIIARLLETANWLKVCKKV